MRQPPALGQLHFRHLAQHLPRPCRHLFPGPGRAAAILLEQPGDGLLDGIVVVVADLGLPVLEGPVAGRARREEQVRIGGPRGLEVGVQQPVPVLLADRPLLLDGQCVRQPGFGQGGQAPFAVQPFRRGQRLDAGIGILAAVLRVQAQHGHGLARRRAEPAGGEHVAPALGDVVLRADGRHLDARATGAQQDGKERRRPHRHPSAAALPRDHGRLPAVRGWRMARENAAASGPGRAGLPINACSRKAAKGWPRSRPPCSYRYSGR
ncbi:hypothetical protein FQZ97_617700 [compost metagenome]